MHQLFLVSSCHYLQKGIREVMALVPVQVMTVSRPEEIPPPGREPGGAGIGSFAGRGNSLPVFPVFMAVDVSAVYRADAGYCRPVAD